MSLPRHRTSCARPPLRAAPRRLAALSATLVTLAASAWQPAWAHSPPPASPPSPPLQADEPSGGLSPGGVADQSAGEDGVILPGSEPASPGAAATTQGRRPFRITARTILQTPASPAVSMLAEAPSDSQILTATVTVRVTEPSSDIVLTVQVPDGLRYVPWRGDPEAGGSGLPDYDSTEGVLTWRGISATEERPAVLRYLLRPAGLAALSEPANLVLDTRVQAPDLAPGDIDAASAILRIGRRVSALRAIRAERGGRVRLGARIGLEFAPGALPSDATVSGILYAPDTSLAGADPSLRFELEPDARFAAPVTLTVDLRGIAPTSAPRPTLWHVRPEVVTRTLADENGVAREFSVAIPAGEEVASDYDPSTGRLTAELGHFSSYIISFSPPQPEPWKLGVNAGSVSLFRGASTYAHPIDLPAAAGGLQPDLALRYSSAAADAGASGSLPGLEINLGAGWDMETPRVTRVVQRKWALAPWDLNNVAHWAMCSFYVYDYWQYCRPYLETRYVNDFVLTLGGRSHYLVPAFDVNAQAGGEYVTEAYAPLRALRCNARYGAAQDARCNLSVTNGTGEYWQVWTPDGTRYVFGIDANSANLVRQQGPDGVVPDACYNGTTVANASYAGTGGADGCSIPRVWFLRRAYTVHGDSVADGRWSMEYAYSGGSSIIYGPGPQPCAACQADDPWLRPASILYGPGTRPDGSAAVQRYSVSFSYGAESRLSSISVGVANAAGVVWRWIRRYVTDVRSGWPNHAATHVLVGVTEQAWDAAGAVHSPPATTFTYAEQPHANQQNTLLSAIDNGYGGEWRYAYAGDVYHNSYWVTVMTATAQATGWLATHTYAYSPERCYAEEATAGQCANAAHAHWNQWPYSLAGFRQVTETVRDASGTVFAATRHTFVYNDLKRLGQESSSQRLDASGAVLESQQIDLLARNGPSFDPQASWFIAPATVTAHLAGDLGTSPHRRITYTYDAYGSVLSTVEYGLNTLAGDERTTHRTYNHNANAWIIGKLGSERLYEGLSADTRGPALATETILTYDGAASASTPPTRGLPTREVKGKAGEAQTTRTISYDRLGNPLAFTDGRGNATTAAYDANGWFLTSATNAAGHTTRYIYYCVNEAGGACTAGQPYGALKAVRDPNSSPDCSGVCIQTLYTYDVFGRLATVVRPGDSEAYPTLRYDYADNYTAPGLRGSRMTQTTRETSGCAACVHTRLSFYDGLGRLAQTRSERTGDAQRTVVSYLYDALSRVARQSVPTIESASYGDYAAPNWSAVPSTSTDYDVLGRFSRSVGPDGTQTSAGYGGATSARVDANGHRLEHDADGLGRLVTVREYSGTQVLTTRYRYDAMGNLTQTIDARGNVLAIQYDALGRKLSIADPDAGARAFGYDGNGNVVTQTDALSQRVVFLYDALDRLVEKRAGSAAGALLARFTYDAGSNGIGRRASMWNANDATAWLYDARGRVVSETRTISGVGTFTTLYAYDAADRLASMRYPSNELVQFAYDDAMRPESAGSSLAAYVSQVEYNALGQPSRIDYGNGVSQRYWYWGLDYIGSPANRSYGRLRRMCVTGPSVTECPDVNGAGPLLNVAYAYDGIGNITNIGDRTRSEAMVFSHDDLNRIRSFALNGTAQESYAYDAIGNLTWKTGAGAYAYAASNGGATRPHAVSQAGANTYAYDANGNVVTRVEAGVTYAQTWNEDHRLASVSKPGLSVSLLYDADGRLVKRVAGSQVTAYVGPHYETTGGVAASYYYLGGPPASIGGASAVAMRRGSALTWLHGDHLGSASLGTDAAGAKAGELRYMPFGAVRVESGAAAIDRRFTGQRSDAGIGLYDYGSRAYSPLIGRFMSADAIVPQAANPQSLNRYAYALNMPLAAADPTGRASGAECAAGGDPWQNQWCWDNRWYEAHGYFWDANSTSWVAGKQLARFGDGDVLRATLAEAGIEVRDSASRAWSFSELALIGQGVVALANKLGGLAGYARLGELLGGYAVFERAAQSFLFGNAAAQALPLFDSHTAVFYDSLFRTGDEWFIRGTAVHELAHLIDYNYGGFMAMSRSIPQGYPVSAYAEANHLGLEYFPESVTAWVFDSADGNPYLDALRRLGAMDAAGWPPAAFPDKLREFLTNTLAARP